VVRSWLPGDPWSLLERNRDGCLPLRLAVRHRPNVETVQFLVDACPQALQVTENSGWVPLHHASHCKAPMPVLVVLVSAWEAALQLLAESLPTGAEGTSCRCTWRLGACLSMWSRHLLPCRPLTARQEEEAGGPLPVHAAAQVNTPLSSIYFLARARPEAIGCPAPPLETLRKAQCSFAAEERHEVQCQRVLAFGLRNSGPSCWCRRRSREKKGFARIVRSQPSRTQNSVC
jgi:hypothetical protein